MHATQYHQRHHSHRRPVARGNGYSRRGSVLVLVAGILVLLVIVGFAYLSRTRSERVQAIAHQDNGREIDRARAIRDDIANEIAESLFPRPIDPSSLGFGPFNTEDPNTPRLVIEPFAQRYGIDRLDTDGLPVYRWNQAAYSTRAWTNWPDNYVDPVSGTAPRTDDILGNPGTNDSRWLASNEPERWRLTLEDGLDGSWDTPDVIDVFTHWQHMTNLARPGNGYIHVHDISDVYQSVTDSFNFGPMTGPYGTPFEQWLPHSFTTAPATPPGTFLPATFDTTRGKNFINTSANWEMDWKNRWDDWYRDHEAALFGLGSFNLGIPGNYFNLNDCGLDLDFSGFNDRLEFGERPEDEFMGPGDDLTGTYPLGSPRWFVAKRLADADGDGWTDSFWFLAPGSVDSDIRTLVAARVVDLSGLINVNVATQFVRGNPSPPNFVNHGTRGHTPSDVALYEYLFEGEFLVGFLNNAENSEAWFPDGAGIFPGDVPGAADSPWGELQVWFNPANWDNGPGSILGELGATLTTDYFRNPFNRLDYWRRAGARPFDPAAPYSVFTDAYTPFTMADELELRRFHALNSAWMQSRLEKAFQANTITGAGAQILRATLSREETSTYLDMLDVRRLPNGTYFDEVLHDLRRQITTFNTSRNETMPPWMWWEYRFVPGAEWLWPAVLDPNDPNALPFFIAKSRLKLDLRERNYPLPSQADAFVGDRAFAQRLVPTLMLALTDGELTLAPNINSYYYDYGTGNEPAALADTWRLATAYAANILSYRDDDDLDNDLIDDPVSAPVFANPADPTSVGALRVPAETGERAFTDRERFLGMEAQPFLVETFIAHVYESNGPVPIGLGYRDEGQNYVDNTADVTTVVAVQIANPTDRVINLDNYKLRIFGQEVQLTGLLLPAIEEEPRTAIILSIEADFSGNASFGADWANFLDVEAADLFGTLGTDTLIIPATLSRVPSDYSDANEAVELVRITPDAAWTGTVDVVIDRIDNPNDPDVAEQTRYRDAVHDLQSDVKYLPPPPDLVDPTRLEGIRINSDDYFVVWARSVRLWAEDINNNNLLEDNERGPRYVFTSHPEGFAQGSPIDLPITTYNGEFGDATVYEGDSYAAADDPDSQTDPWISRIYEDPAGVSRDRKPTFFPCYSVYDTGTSLPAYRAPMAGDIINLADKGVKDADGYFYPHPLQMLIRNADFEQIGELLYVFLYGHRLEVDALGTLNPLDDVYLSTEKTFSEHMSDARLVGLPAASGQDGFGQSTNRLVLEPREVTFGGTTTHLGSVVGNVLTTDDYTAGSPALPAGQRVLSCFVCDDYGYNLDPDGDGDIDENGNSFDLNDLRTMEANRFRNAQGYSGAGTPGMININNVTLEVGRAMPHAARLVHETSLDDSNTLMPHLIVTTEYGAGRMRIMEAIAAYRNRLGWDDPNDVNPRYGGRGLRAGLADPLDFSRGDFGYESIGEVANLRRPGRSGAGGADAAQWNTSWRADAVAHNHLASIGIGPAQVDMDLSTDVVDRFDVVNNIMVADDTQGDDEEAAMLYAGISNIITTRSDAFVVYFRVRNIRRNATTGIWDGTDPEHIVEDSRYVMVIDRSGVNRPTDKPRILLFEKVPN
ncbi:MAG: hypothetical protein ACR2GY_02015 [Phycisphaerales bacterium]